MWLVNGDCEEVNTVNRTGEYTKEWIIERSNICRDAVEYDVFPFLIGGGFGMIGAEGSIQGTVICNTTANVLGDS